MVFYYFIHQDSVIIKMTFIKVSRFLITDISVVLGFLCCMHVDNIANVLEVHADSFYDKVYRLVGFSVYSIVSNLMMKAVRASITSAKSPTSITVQQPNNRINSICLCLITIMQSKIIINP